MPLFWRLGAPLECIRLRNPELLWEKRLRANVKTGPPTLRLNCRCSTAASNANDPLRFPNTCLHPPEMVLRGRMFSNCVVSSVTQRYGTGHWTSRWRLFSDAFLRYCALQTKSLPPSARCMFAVGMRARTREHDKFAKSAPQLIRNPESGGFTVRVRSVCFLSFSSVAAPSYLWQVSGREHTKIVGENRLKQTRSTWPFRQLANSRI